MEHTSGGWTRDYFNITIISLIGLFNFINQVFQSKDFIGRLYLTLPFLALSILIYNKHTSKMIKSIIFVLLGIGYQIAIPDASYIGASVFFVLSFMQHKNIKYGICLSLITLIMISIKATQVNHSPSQLIVAVMAFTFIYGNIYMLLRNNIARNNLTEREKVILKLYIKGYDYAKIDKTLKLDLDKSSIRKIITRVRDKSGCVNDIQFGKWLYDKG